MISKDSIESAYCFLHQKYRVYKFSNNETQRDDIELPLHLRRRDEQRTLCTACQR